MSRTKKSHPRYKDIIMNEEYNHDRFWEWERWAYLLADGIEQFDHLVAHGLKPHHYLLDIGCGWLRGGINFIDYLDIGHYYGFDKDQKQANRGEILLKGKNLIYKKPKIKLVTSTKGIWSFIGRGMKFDYMMAYSVFTHIDPYMAARLFTNIIPFLKDDGKFFVTFISRSKNEIFVGDKHLSRSDEYKQVKYPFSFFEDLARENGYGVKELHLEDAHKQNWMCFYRK